MASGRCLISQEAFDSLDLEQLEEVSGELHRRLGTALRHLGEPRADRLDGDGSTPRRRVAALAAHVELAGATLGAIAAGGTPPLTRADRHPAVVAAVMYATPTVNALLARLEQDRRLLTSLARGLEHRLADTHDTAWGSHSLRRLLSEVSIAEPARVAQSVERSLADADAEEARAAEARGEGDV